MKVLPALSAPVALADTSSDADRLIEELMAEAERDPGLRELSGLNGRGRGRPTTPEALSPQKYPMVKRPYRTQQDMIIRDEADHAASSSASRMIQSSGVASRSNQSSSIASRSKSADTRPREGRGGGRPLV